jgi:hypothetical protein
MHLRWFQRRFVAAAFLMIPTLGLAQVPTQSGTIAVDGYSGKIPVVRINGKSYVDVDALARITNGSVGYPGNQMTLTIPPPDPRNAAPKKGFSPEFLRAGIEAMATIREWRAALQHAVQNNYPVTDDWVGGFRREAESRRALAGVAATTDDDRSGLMLFDMEMALMQKLSDNYQSLSKSSTYVTADSFNRDPLNQQVLDCAHGLSAMAGGGQYQDVNVCH